MSFAIDQFISEVTHMLSHVEDDCAKRICSQLFNQLHANPGVLPILADIVTQSEKLRGFLKNSSISSSILDLNDPCAEDIKYVIEIYCHVLDQGNDILTHLPDLLAIAKKFWSDEEMMYGIVTLLMHAVTVCDDEEIDRLDEQGILMTVPVLSALLFSHNPSAMGINRTLDFPRNTEYSKYCFSHLLLWAVSEVVDVPESTEDCSNMIRPLIPIISHILKFISQDYVNIIDECSIRNLLKLCFDLEMTFVEEDSSSYKKDIKLLLNSKIPEWLLTIFKKSSLKRCCEGSGSESHCLPLDKCNSFQAVLDLVNLFTNVKANEILTHNEKIEFFMIWSRLLDDERIFGKNGANPNVVYVVISSVFKSSNLDSPAYLQFLYDPEQSPLPSIIQFVSRHTDNIGFFCLVLSEVFDDERIVLKDLFPLLIMLPNVILKFLLIPDNDLSRIDKKKMDFLRHSSSSSSSNIKIKSLAPNCAFTVLAIILSSITIDQLQELETQFGIFNQILKLLKKTADLDGLLQYVDLLNNLDDKQLLTFLRAEKLLEIMSIVWDKFKISTHITDHAVISLTYNVSLYLPESCQVDYSDFIPALLSDLKNIHRLKPQNPGMFKLIWQLAKRPNHKQLFKRLVKLSCQKSVEYASPGKRELAQIYKLITDLIIENLEHEPPLNANYLHGLTKCMILIARSSTLDEEFFMLEDMVSPAIWLLEKQEDEKIVANVKEFIGILH